MTRVRPGRPADLDPLAPAQAALSDPAPALLTGALTRDGPTTVLVAVDDRPVGYLLAVPGPEAVYVPEIAVRPDRHGEGHGSALLSALFARADGVVRLTVAVENERARRFYERHGFAVAERVPDRFESGDGLVLVRSA